MRSVRKAAPSEDLIAVSACDPLNLAGVLTPGQRVPALIGNRVAFRDGVPLASLQSGDVVMHADLSTEDQDALHRFLQPTNNLAVDYLSPIAAKIANTR